MTNFSNIPALSAILAAGIAALILNKCAKNHKKLREFSFPISMIIGMLASCIVNAAL